MIPYYKKDNQVHNPPTWWPPTERLFSGFESVTSLGKKTATLWLHQGSISNNIPNYVNQKKKKINDLILLIIYGTIAGIFFNRLPQSHFI